MPNVYGSDYSDVANRELSMDQARDSRYFQSLAANRAMAQMAQQQAQQEQANRMAAIQMMQQQRAQQAQQAMQQQALQMDQARQMQASRQWAQEMGLRRAQLNDTLGQQEYGEATRAVSQGLVQPNQLQAMFPRLNTIQQQRLGQYYNTMGQQEVAQDAESNAMAESVNAMLKARQQAAAVNSLGSKPTSWWSQLLGRDDAYDQKKAEALQNPTQLDPAQWEQFVGQLMKNRRMMDTIAIDPDEQKVTAIPQPRMFPGVGAPVAAPQAGPATPPATAPARAQQNVESELRIAQAAIAKGKDPMAVRAMFKQRTGMEMP